MIQVFKFYVNFAPLIGAHELRNQNLRLHNYRLAFATHTVGLTFAQDLWNSCVRMSHAICASRSVRVALHYHIERTPPRDTLRSPTLLKYMSTA